MALRTRRLAALGVGLLALVAHPGQAQTPAPHAVTGLHWLAGCWERRAGTLLLEEQWLIPRGGVLLGASRTTRSDSLVEYEFMRIYSRGDTLVFAAQPSGQAPAEFRTVTPGDHEVTFENARHDFPQRIRYRAVGSDSLIARIEGTRGGQARSVDVPYARTVCPGDSANARGTTTRRVADTGAHPLGTLRAHTQVRQEWLELRLQRVLPRLMREQGVEMWIMPSREYNEDPVFFSIVSPTTLAARRRTIYVFHDRGPELGVERIAIGGTSQGGLYTVVRDPQARPGAAAGTVRLAEPFGPEQWTLLTPIVRERDPRTIAVNISHVHHFADGLTAGEWEQLQEALGPEYVSRVVQRPLLAVQYIEERLPEMLPVYTRMQELVHEIIATAFSHRVITPGVTTTQDVVWWLRQRTNDLGLGTWFQPTISVQRRGADMSDSTNPVILRGDVLHCDFGITALGLNTDTQHMGYVLLDGETEPPAGLRAGLARSNQLQDLLLEEMLPGRTGNEVLAATLARMLGEGIDGTVYTHPIGDHGHGAGPTIGLWDRQEGVPGRGDVPLRTNTWFSIELQATSEIPEWGGQRVRIAQEEEALIDSSGNRRWVLRRQDMFHLVRDTTGSTGKVIPEMSQSEHDRRIDYVEFLSTDIQRSKRFYSDVFGWEFTDYGPEYTSFSDGRLSGGFAAAPRISPGGPLVVIYATSLMETEAAVKRAGGRVTREIFEFPGGRRFHFADLDGNELAVWSDS